MSRPDVEPRPTDGPRRPPPVRRAGASRGRSLRRGAALVLLLFATGCAAPGWAEARGADAMDLVGLRLGVGPGLGAYARATRWVQLGILVRGPRESDLPAPEGFEPRGLPCLMVGTIGRYGGIWEDLHEEVMIPGFSSRDTGQPIIRRESIAGYVDPRGRRDRWEYAFGAGVHAVLVGVEAEVRPFEVFDLLLGLIGYDPSGDDPSPEGRGDASSEES